MLCNSSRCFYKSRSETTAFDQRYFRGRLDTSNGCQQVLRPKHQNHRGVFRRFSCPLQQCELCCQENSDGGLVEFLRRRLEEYQRTLRVMYGRVRESVAFQETSPAKCVHILRTSSKEFCKPEQRTSDCTQWKLSEKCKCFFLLSTQSL